MFVCLLSAHKAIKKMLRVRKENATQQKVQYVTQSMLEGYVEGRVLAKSVERETSCVTYVIERRLTHQKIRGLLEEDIRNQH